MAETKQAQQLDPLSGIIGLNVGIVNLAKDDPILRQRNSDGSLNSIRIGGADTFTWEWLTLSWDVPKEH